MDKQSLVFQIKNDLEDMLSSYPEVLVKRADARGNAEYAGTLPVMQGKQKVDGHYFASIVPKDKDCRFYFFPIYTHVDQIQQPSTELSKMLKGKSCFHIRNWSDDLRSEISRMIKEGVELYKNDGLI